MSDEVGNTSVEEIYQKKTQLEHILLRPDTYIGSIEKATPEMWIVLEEKMVYQQITYVPGLYKIFDEILVNAADNAQRDKNMKEIRISISAKENKVAIRNDGKGIEIRKHKKEQIWIPELIFGHLLTSSNFNDDERKTTGGRNGYGAKLCNVFSTEFTVETADGKQKYFQRFTNNMSVKDTPVITKYSGKQYTEITFYPDLAKFNMQLLDQDIVGLMTKRAYDMAGTVKGINVFLNKTKIPIKSFKDYCQLFHQEEGSDPILFDQCPNWEVALLPSQGQFQHCSFVNNINTYKGGAHVYKIAEAIVQHISQHLIKKHKLTVKPFQIKNHLFLFVNCLITNPSFDSQTKEYCTTTQSKFGSKYEPSDAFLKRILSSSIIKNVIASASNKQQNALKKSDGTKKSFISGIPKLDDANCAGTAQSSKCTLILTEGDSAKSLAVCGLSIVGRDYYGCFPLRGKLLNTRDASVSQIEKNQEIQHLKKILGLQQRKQYTDTKSLRYGCIMLMADQDTDGSHIKGLVMNFIDTFWPSLLKVKGFLKEFITPLVVCNNKPFFTQTEYNAYILTNAIKTVKYYKGLGTSTSKEAKQYFSHLQTHVLGFLPANDQDQQALQLVFNKKQAEDRKQWLLNYELNTYLDHSRKQISIHEFINKEFINFSMADNQRSIPSMIDGLKPGQRKVLFGCFKRKLTQEIKVAQLSGYIAEHTAYHHGEQSLQQTILHLAQDFVGSNNIPLLQPIGQFGTRLTGGKDAASARYIFTALSELTRLIFHSNDDDLLQYLQEDGQSIEPLYYVPILPMVLINGSSGIGTGYSSSIPNYNPLDVIQCLKNKMNHMPLEMIHPYYKHFEGDLQVQSEYPMKYLCKGIMVNTNNPLLIEVTELPIGTWTQTFKEYLNSMIPDDVQEYKEYHTDTKIHFKLTLAKESSKTKITSKLNTVINTSNLTAFDSHFKLKKYDSVLDIIEEYFLIRLDLYKQRKQHLLGMYMKEMNAMGEKQRFIQLIVDDELILNKKSKKEIHDQMIHFKFTQYNHLLQLPLIQLTLEKIDQLREEQEALQLKIDLLTQKTAEMLWMDDLEALEQALEGFTMTAVKLTQQTTLNFKPLTAQERVQKMMEEKKLKRSYYLYR